MNWMATSHNFFFSAFVTSVRYCAQVVSYSGLQCNVIIHTLCIRVLLTHSTVPRFYRHLQMSRFCNHHNPIRDASDWSCGRKKSPNLQQGSEGTVSRATRSPAADDRPPTVLISASWKQASIMLLTDYLQFSGFTHCVPNSPAYYVEIHLTSFIKCLQYRWVDRHGCKLPLPFATHTQRK